MSFILSNKQGTWTWECQITESILKEYSLYHPSIFYMWRVFLSLSQTYAVPAPLSYSSPSPLQSTGHVMNLSEGTYIPDFILSVNVQSPLETEYLNPK